MSMDNLTRLFRRKVIRTWEGYWEVGYLGKADGTIVDEHKSNHLWVRRRDQTYVSARNDGGVPHTPDLPVNLWLERESVYVIKSVNRDPALAVVPPSPPTGIASHTHDDRYFRENEHLSVSVGAADAGKPVVLDAGGFIDGSMLDPADLATGAVSSVNGQTGVVVLDADDIDDTSTAAKFATAAELTKLAGIEALADVTDAANVGTAIDGTADVGAPADTDQIAVIRGGSLGTLLVSALKTALTTLFDGLYVLLAGSVAQTITGVKTFTGDVHIGDGTGTPNLRIDGAAATSRSLAFRTGGVNRFLYQVTGTAEAGANSGSNWALLIRDDAGASLGVAILVERATGNIALGAPTTIDFAVAKLGIVQAALGTPVLTLQSIASGDDPAESVTQNRITTTSATPATLHTVAIAANYTYVIRADVIARRTGGASGTADDGAAYTLRSAYTTKAGVVTLLGTAMEAIAREDVAGWDAALVISGTNVLVQVTGAATTNITWHATIRIWRVGS